MPLPSNTSPVVLKRDLDVQRIPETGSVSTIDATPAAILSASDLHMNQGTVTMPGANQSAEGTEQGGLGTGKTPNSLQQGTGETGSTGTDKGSGKGQSATRRKVRRARNWRLSKGSWKRHGGKWHPGRYLRRKWNRTQSRFGIRTIEWARLGRW